MTVTISRKATSKVTKHGLNVYPLEAYGFLIGTPAPAFIYAALPAGKTSRWYEPVDRFYVLEQGYGLAKEFAKGIGLSLIGIYHTGVSDERPHISPLQAVPANYRHLFVLITPTLGGESIWRHNLYQWESGRGWQECDFKIVLPRATDPGLNARRIRHQWLSVWGPIDYSNNYETEYYRLYGA